MNEETDGEGEEEEGEEWVEFARTFQKGKVGWRAVSKSLITTGHM